MGDIKAKARAAFKVFSAPFDPASDNWNDMDAEALFVEGFAAAIREDRAEPVSEAEIEVALYEWRAREGDCTWDAIKAEAPQIAHVYREWMRRALEAARQARATADEKGGAR